ncbi:MAG: HD domain-containing protein [Sphingomonadales bacterium]
MKQLLLEVEKRVREKFTDQEGSHDWFHIDRVRKNALLLQKSEGGDAQLIELAALLHDFSDHKYNGGDFQAGQQDVYALLLELHAPEKIAHAVAQIVGVVSYKGAQVPDEKTSLEGQIVRDADRLDAIGAIGIARAFAYGGSRGRALYDPAVSPTLHKTKEAYAQDKGHTINHFYEKLLLLQDRMETQSAKVLAANRHQFMLEFLKQFKNDWAAENPDID